MARAKRGAALRARTAVQQLSQAGPADTGPDARSDADDDAVPEPSGTDSHSEPESEPGSDASASPSSAPGSGAESGSESEPGPARPGPRRDGPARAAGYVPKGWVRPADYLMPKRPRPRRVRADPLRLAAKGYRKLSDFQHYGIGPLPRARTPRVPAPRV